MPKPHDRTPAANTASLTLEALRAHRLRAQCLAPRRPRQDLLAVVKAMCGVNAQLPSAMALSLRARVEGLTQADIEVSRVQERAVVRTWCMRGTMHLLATDDLDWLLAAINPAEVRGAWRWLEKRGGLQRERAAQVLDAAYEILKARGPLTRRALMAAVAEQYGSEGEDAAAGLVHLNGLLGRVCFGPWQGASPTYVALDDWLGRTVATFEGPDYLKLAVRYLHGYGPATPQELAAWWGLPLSAAQAAWTRLQPALVAYEIAGQTVWHLAEDGDGPETALEPGPVVRLLPAFDTYLLGYQDRDFAVAPEYQRHIFHGGQVVPTILVDGCAAGTWHYTQRGKQIQVEVMPFSPFSAEIRDLIAIEVEDIGRFFGVRAALT